MAVKIAHFVALTQKGTGKAPHFAAHSTTYIGFIMLLYLILAFTVGPLIECGLLLFILKTTGWEITLSIVVFTGIIGGYLAKRQGWHAWRNIQRAMREGRLPGSELMHGLLILIAGVLLVTPGVMTDLCGFFLLLPMFREYLAQRLLRHLKQKVVSGNVRVFTTNPGNPFAQSTTRTPTDGNPDVIDVEAQPVDLDGSED